MARKPIHPGEHLREQLEELRMSAAELARQLRVPTNRVTQILKGQRAVTGDTALRRAERESGNDVRRLPRLSDLGRRTHAA